MIEDLKPHDSNHAKEMIEGNVNTCYHNAHKICQNSKVYYLDLQLTTDKSYQQKELAFHLERRRWPLDLVKNPVSLVRADSNIIEHLDPYDYGH